MRIWVVRRSSLRAALAGALLLLGLAAVYSQTSPVLPAGGAPRAPVYRGVATSRPAVAITFDDGPDPLYTPQILDTLDQFQARATFFVVGTQAERYPSLLRTIVLRGHEVGTHSYSHLDLTRLSRQAVASDLGQADTAISRATGSRPRDLRPPYGFVNSFVLEEAARLGYRVILWTDEHDTRDWKRPDPAVIVQRALAHAENGMILLLHDSGGNRTQTLRALPIVLKALQERGFRFVTVDELLQPRLADAAY